MSKLNKTNSKWRKTIQEYKDNSTLYVVVFVAIVLVTLLTWGALKLWAPSSFDNGMAYLLLPLIVFILAPAAFIFVVILFMLLIPVWSNISLNKITGKKMDLNIVDPVNLVHGLGFEQCVDIKDNSIPDSLLMRSKTLLNKSVFKQISGDLVRYLYFAEHGYGHAVALIRQYSKEVSFPTCVISSKINDAVLPLAIPVQTSELFSYIPTDAEKLITVNTSKSSQRRVMQLLSPEVVLSYINNGLQFDTYLNGNLIELAFVTGNDKESLATSIRNSDRIFEKLLSKVLKDSEKSSSIRWRLSNEASVVYKHLDKYFIRAIKIFFISALVFIISFGVMVNTESFEQNPILFPIFITFSIIGGLAFLYGVFGFVANFALLGYTFAIHSLFMAINKAIVAAGAIRAKRAHSYLGIKYSYEE